MIYGSGVRFKIVISDMFRTYCIRLMRGVHGLYVVDFIPNDCKHSLIFSVIYLLFRYCTFFGQALSPHKCRKSSLQKYFFKWQLVLMNAETLINIICFQRKPVIFVRVSNFIQSVPRNSLIGLLHDEDNLFCYISGEPTEMLYLWKHFWFTPDWNPYTVPSTPRENLFFRTSSSIFIYNNKK